MGIRPHPCHPSAQAHTPHHAPTPQYLRESVWRPVSAIKPPASAAQSPAPHLMPLQRGIRGIIRQAAQHTQAQPCRQHTKAARLSQAKDHEALQCRQASFQQRDEIFPQNIAPAARCVQNHQIPRIICAKPSDGCRFSCAARLFSA
jgi:hypothetical protein